MKARKVHAGVTELQWIHSHVDDEDRRKRVKPPRKDGVDWWEDAGPKSKQQERAPITPLVCA